MSFSWHWNVFRTPARSYWEKANWFWLKFFLSPDVAMFCEFKQPNDMESTPLTICNLNRAATAFQEEIFHICMLNNSNIYGKCITVARMIQRNSPGHFRFTKMIFFFIHFFLPLDLVHSPPMHPLMWIMCKIFSISIVSWKTSIHIFWNGKFLVFLQRSRFIRNAHLKCDGVGRFLNNFPRIHLWSSTSSIYFRE